MLVLLAAVATGAMAQETYKVSVKEGTEDASNWQGKAGEGEYQALPLEGVAANTAVSVKYNGTKKVKSVKAVKKAAKPDLLPAVFTVDAGKTVKFSKGNLQATYNGSSWIWGFAEHQWDYIGNAAGNTSINGNGTVSANGTVDLFGWVGASSTWTGAAQYGISNSTATNNVDGYGNVGGEAQKVGWGATVGTGWRTLTRLEWLHLLNERETGVTVNSTNHARYTLAIINTDGTAVKGLIIFPDSYAGGSPAGVTWGTINAKSTFDTTCTSEVCTALEAAGCVFLPAAGYREASNVTDAGIGAGYWSSSSSAATTAIGPYFESDYMSIQYVSSRKYGYSVRLVQAVAAEPVVTDLSTKNADYTANDGETLTGTLGADVKISIADGATVTLNNVTINGTNNIDYGWAGITCLGDATIILSGTNTVTGFYEDYPGIQAAAGKTLTINGTGSLTASSNDYGAGIGGGFGISCGNIEIQGGVITATGGDYAAGIGAASGVGTGESICGTITISGGTVTAIGGSYAAGIGSGYAQTKPSTCGAISISGGTVSAKAGALAPAAIGKGNVDAGESTCASVTITPDITSLTLTNTNDDVTGIVSDFINATAVNANTTPITYMLPTSVTDPTITGGMDYYGFATSYNDGTKTWTITKK